MAKKVMSFSLNTETQDKIKIMAKEQGVSVSSLMDELIAAALSKQECCCGGKCDNKIALTDNNAIAMVEDAAQSKQCSPEALLNKLAKHVSIVAHKDDETPVILTIPTGLLQKQDEMRKWLNIKAEVIIQSLCKE